MDGDVVEIQTDRNYILQDNEKNSSIITYNNWLLLHIYEMVYSVNILNSLMSFDFYGHRDWFFFISGTLLFSIILFQHEVFYVCIVAYII